MTTTTANIKQALPPSIQATMALGDDHAIQIIEFFDGTKAIVESGRAIDQVPATPGEVEGPPDAGKQASGERAGDGDPSVLTTDEQVWFRNTFCNGAQACLQGWDWATCGTDRAVGFGTGIAMVGREGSHNATLFVDMWQCNGQECFWVQNWQGTVVPGHWLSVNTNAPDRKWLRWRLVGAGGDTQVSLAAKY
ncbi:hypothetical protein ACGF3G_29855 [Streptomyces sp. NPDC048179]|uniref:hypothetical protein n=1 Tax=Streptomyces sp. NPDC048179 TaxID=3365506 RepID=UPI003720E45E